jgi:hypothetical protein
MACRHATVVVLGLVMLVVGSPAHCAKPSPPSAYYGFEPGSDRELIDYQQLTSYLEQLAGSSDRVELRQVGASPLGLPMYGLFLSSAANLARLEALREINQRLALDTQMSESERASLVTEGRVFVMITLSMHSSEVGPSQALSRFAYEIATTTDPEISSQLEDIVLLVVPCHNPDGMNMIVEHYRKYRGGPYEGSSMPGVYHKYVGHDNNRDFVSLTQRDTRVISRLYSTEWYPQVLVEKHQMGRAGPRFFVPANHDPIAEILDEDLWYWSAVFGAMLAKDMGRDGLKGIASHWLFDNYWPGSTETALWKGVIAFLTEGASCAVATPVFVDPTELEPSGKGLAEYKKGVNMPDPWPGGWWRLSDIVRYEHSSFWSIIRTAAQHREEILRLRNELSRREVAKGLNEAPAYYALPATQHDPLALDELARLLVEHGVEVFSLNREVQVDSAVLPAGSVIVPLAQPYRSFIKEVMETQRYPVRHYTPGGEVIKPYDITSWSLPVHYGIRSLAIGRVSHELDSVLRPYEEAEATPEASLPEKPPWGLAYSPSANESYRIAFAALSRGLSVQRVGGRPPSGRETLDQGSFVIRATRGQWRDLRQLATETRLRPTVLNEEPDAELSPVSMPRIGLVETYFHDMDAGWTRFLFDEYGIPYRVLRPGEIEGTELENELDVLVFPDASREVLTKGRWKHGDDYAPNDYPPEYTKGISKQGLARIASFITKGGVVVSWGASVNLFLDDEPSDAGEQSLELPCRDVSEQLEDKGLLIPGAFLRASFREGTPVTLGMPSAWGVFADGSPVLSTSLPVLDSDRRVVAAYPEDGVLWSGYAERDFLLGNRPAAAWVRKGSGQLVLFGFRPQFRASTPATFKLVFNALLLPRGWRPPPPPGVVP